MQNWNQPGPYGPPPEPPQPLQPRKKSLGWLWIAIVGVGVVVLGFGGCGALVCMGVIAGAGASKVPSTPATQVDVNMLIAEYDSNEVSADSKYKGKVVKTVGIVRDVNKDLFGNPYVVIGGPGGSGYRGVQCSVKGNTDVTSLQRGATAEVQGRVSGLMVNVKLDDCAIRF